MSSATVPKGTMADYVALLHDRQLLSRGRNARGRIAVMKLRAASPAQP